MLAEALRPSGYSQYRAKLDDLLGISTDASDFDVHRAVSGGISAERLMDLSSSGLINPQERDQVIPLKTLKARIEKHQALTGAESDRLFRIAHIRAMAETLFGDPDKARRWLSKPKARFDGLSPMGMLVTFQGCRMVEEMLIQIGEGFSF